MLTGDNAATAKAIADQLGIDEVRADLMPADKVKAIAEFQSQGHRVAMVGDGVNDAPALARADVGIAMGGAGTQAALEAADVALMTDDLAKIAAARAIARKAYRTCKRTCLWASALCTCWASPQRCLGGSARYRRQSSILDPTSSFFSTRSSCSR
jgi:P-type E1-E2 ATPase